MSHEPTASDASAPSDAKPPLLPATAAPADGAASIPPLPGGWPVAPGQMEIAYQPVFEQKRLHPATIVVQVVRFIRSAALFLAFAIVARVAGRSADTVELIITAMGGLSIVGAVLKYVSYRYSIRDGALHVTSGIIQKQHRTIPLERIQNINLKQELVHRMMGVADVRIETASGGSAEAELSVVSVAEAEALRIALAAPRSASGDAVPAEEEVVYSASVKHLILAGATQNRLGTLIAGVIGVIFYINQFGGDRNWRIERVVERLIRDTPMPGWIGWVLIGLGLIAIGWVASILLTLYSQYGFKLVRSSGQLQRSFGSVTRHRSIFPVQRVQMLRVIAPLFQRRVGLCRIAAETAGSFREDEQKNQGTNELCPIIERRRADSMCRLVLSDFALDEVKFQSIHPLGRRRVLVRVLVGLSVALALSAWLLQPALWYGAPAVPIIAWVYAVLYYRTTGYALDESYLTIRRGIWTRVIEVVPLTKVQATFVRESPLQRRLGLASFEVLTAGSVFGRSATIRDVGRGVALELQERAAQNAEKLPASHPESGSDFGAEPVPVAGG